MVNWVNAGLLKIVPILALMIFHIIQDGGTIDLVVCLLTENISKFRHSDVASGGFLGHRRLVAVDAIISLHCKNELAIVMLLITPMEGNCVIHTYMHVYAYCA